MSPGGEVMRLESEGRLDLYFAPGCEVVDGVAVAELGDPLARLCHEVSGDGEDDAEVVGDVEALARQREHALLPHQGFHDLQGEERKIS